MNISIKPVLRTDKIKKSNCAPIHIRFTQNRQKKHIATGISINVDDWDSGSQRITSKTDEGRLFQFQIDSTMQEYYKKAKRLEALDMEVTLDSLIDTNSRKAPNQTVSDYFGRLIADFKRSGKLNTASKYIFCLSSLNKFYFSIGRDDFSARGI